MTRTTIILLSLLPILTSCGVASTGVLPVSVGIPSLLADTDSASNFELAGRIGGPSLAVAVQGDSAFLGFSFEFAVLDVSNPEKPARVGYLPLSANDIALQGDYAYAVGRQGLSVVDISRPERPIQMGTVTTPQAITDVALARGHAFLVGAHAGLRLVDIADPSHPYQVSYLDVPGRVEDVAVAGNYVYLATSDGLSVVDTADKHRPVEIEVGPMAQGAQAIELKGTHAYLTVLGGLIVVDISNPAKPLLIGQLDIPGYLEELAITENVAYLANGPEGLRLVDISDPTHPVLLNVVSLQGLLVDVATADGYVYANNTNGGLFVIDGKNPTTPLRAGRYQAPGPVKDVTVVGHKAYVTAGWGEDELHILDVSDVAYAVELALYPTFGLLGWSVTEKGDFVYAAGGFGDPYAINVSRLSPLTAADTTMTSANISVAETKPSYAYIIDPMGVLRILNVSNRDAPYQVGDYVSPGHATDVVVRGEVALVAVQEEGLHILDVSDAKSPVLLSTVDTPGEAQGVAVDGNHAYIADGYGGLHIIDVANPIIPVMVSTIATSGRAWDVAVTDDTAFVAAGQDGVRMVDVSDPAGPMPMGTIQTYAAMGIAVSDGRLFVADGLGGLLILARG